MNPPRCEVKIVAVGMVGPALVLSKKKRDGRQSYEVSGDGVEHGEPGLSGPP